MTKLTKVRKLLKQCGARMTALYLRNRGYDLDQALVLMFGVREKHIHLAPMDSNQCHNCSIS